MALWIDDLRAGRLPEALRERLPMLLYKPDKNTLEWKALAAACDELRTNPRRAARRMRRDSVDARLPLQRASSRRLSRRASHSRRGGPLPALPELPPPRCARSRSTTRRRPRSTTPSRCATCRTATTRSASTSPRRRSRSRAARRSTRSRAARLSTVYMPGRKITMLPDEVVAAFTLAEGMRRRRCRCTRKSPPTARWCATRRASSACRSPPTCGSTRSATPSRTTCRRRRIRRGRRNCGCCGDSRRRSRPRAARPTSRASTTASTSTGTLAPDGRVSIVPRPRGSPLDKLVSELMIFVNNTWGKLLADARVAGLYRMQSGGKVKMSTRPGEHQGLGARALPVGEFAAAPLQRPRQPARSCWR